MIPQAVAVPGLDRVGLNPWVLGFSLVASLAAAVAFSTVACMGIARDAHGGALVAQRRTTMSGRARRAASGLVAAEIALAVVLLIGAGLTLRSFAKLISVEPGFTADGVITVQLGLPAGRFGEQPARSAAYQRIFAGQLGACPGRHGRRRRGDAAHRQQLDGTAVTAPIVRRPPAERPPEVGWQSASGGYFRALRIPLRAGRLFEARDTEDAPPVVIVSDALAERYFPGEEPVGQRIGSKAAPPRSSGGRGHPPRVAYRRAARRPVFPLRTPERQRRHALSAHGRKSSRGVSGRPRCGAAGGARCAAVPGAHAAKRSPRRRRRCRGWPCGCSAALPSSPLPSLPSASTA